MVTLFFSKPYLQGVARIRCTNPECGHDYFRHFSCKGFYLCPSYSRKRTILFAEHLTNEVLLDRPHRQFVFTLPKALRPKGRWEEMPWVAERAPERWKATHQRDAAAKDLGYEPLSDNDEEVNVDARKRPCHETSRKGL